MSYLEVQPCDFAVVSVAADSESAPELLRKVARSETLAGSARTPSGYSVILPLTAAPAGAKAWAALCVVGHQTQQALCSLIEALARDGIETVLQAAKLTDSFFLVEKAMLASAVTALLGAGCAVRPLDSGLRVPPKLHAASPLPCEAVGSWAFGSSLRLQARGGLFVELQGSGLAASRCGYATLESGGRVARRSLVDLQPATLLSENGDCDESKSEVEWQRLDTADALVVALELEDDAEVSRRGIWIFVGKRFARVVGPPTGSTDSIVASCLCRSADELRRLRGPEVDADLQKSYDALVGELEHPGLLKIVHRAGSPPKDAESERFMFSANDASLGGSIDVRRDEGLVVHSAPGGGQQRWRIHEMSFDPFAWKEEATSQAEAASQEKAPDAQMSLGEADPSVNKDKSSTVASGEAANEGQSDSSSSDSSAAEKPAEAKGSASAAASEADSSEAEAEATESRLEGIVAGSVVKYWSQSVRRWLSSTVVKCNADGTYDLDLKRRAQAKFIQPKPKAAAKEEKEIMTGEKKGTKQKVKSQSSSDASEAGEDKGKKRNTSSESDAEESSDHEEAAAKTKAKERDDSSNADRDESSDSVAAKQVSNRKAKKEKEKHIGKKARAASDSDANASSEHVKPTKKQSKSMKPPKETAKEKGKKKRWDASQDSDASGSEDKHKKAKKKDKGQKRRTPPGSDAEDSGKKKNKKNAKANDDKSDVKDKKRKRGASSSSAGVEVKQKKSKRQKRIASSGSEDGAKSEECSEDSEKKRDRRGGKRIATSDVESSVAGKKTKSKDKTKKKQHAASSSDSEARAKKAHKSKVKHKDSKAKKAASSESRTPSADRKKAKQKEKEKDKGKKHKKTAASASDESSRGKKKAKGSAKTKDKSKKHK